MYLLAHFQRGIMVTSVQILKNLFGYQQSRICATYNKKSEGFFYQWFIDGINETLKYQTKYERRLVFGFHV